MIRNLFQRAVLAATITACVAGASLAADAGERLSVQIDQDGRSETVVIDDLQPGETRQLAAESGKPVIVTRTDDGLEIDIDGDITRVSLAERTLMVRLDGDHPLDIEQLREIALDGAAADADGEHKRIVRVLHAGHAGAEGDAAHRFHVRHLDADGAEAADGSKHRIVMLRHDGDGEVDIEAMLQEQGIELPSGDGKRVIVKREVIK